MASTGTKRAAVAAITTGDNTLVAAVTGRKIRLMAAVLYPTGGTGTIRFESGAGGTALTGQMVVAANTEFLLPYNPVGWFETAAATLLNLELTAAGSVSGWIIYEEVE